MYVLDTFAGIGGFSLAFQHAGAEIVAQSEIDPQRNELLERRFPGVEKLGDVTNVTAERIGTTVDVLAGGTPCQDLSIAGMGAGLAGTRSGLWFEYLRLARELKPRWLVWENVPNALSSNGGKDFRTILMGLDECGYHVAWRVLDAQYFGVPQRRRRIFLVGSFGDGRAAEILFESGSLPGNSKSRPAAWEKAAGTVGTILASGSGVARHGNNNETDFLVYRLQQFGKYTQGITASTIQRRDYKSATDIVFCAHASTTASGVSASMTTSPTPFANRARPTPAVMCQDELRRLTPLECERLQGFPDGWTEGYSDSTRYSMVGDSIAVPVAEWIATRIVELEATSGAAAER